MGKYLIRVESMDGDAAFDKEYADGIECDGFCILADNKERGTVAIHRMSVDMISDVMVHSGELMQAGILAKAKKEIVQIGKQSEAGENLRKILDEIR